MDFLINLFEPVVMFIVKRVSPLLEPAYKAGAAFIESIGMGATVWIFLTIFAVSAIIVLHSLGVKSSPGEENRNTLSLASINELEPMYTAGLSDSPIDPVGRDYR